MKKAAVIRKMTSKGQVTLPAIWRDKFETDNVLISESQDGSLLIRPYEIDDEGWETIFDAARDNGGKGIAPDSLIKLLDSMDSLNCE